MAESDNRDMKLTVAGYLKQFEAMEVTFERNYRMWEAEKHALEQQVQALQNKTRQRATRDALQRRGVSVADDDGDESFDEGASEASGEAGRRRMRNGTYRAVLVPGARWHCCRMTRAVTACGRVQARAGGSEGAGAPSHVASSCLHCR